MTDMLPGGLLGLLLSRPRGCARFDSDVTPGSRKGLGPELLVLTCHVVAVISQGLVYAVFTTNPRDSGHRLADSVPKAPMWPALRPSPGRRAMGECGGGTASTCLLMADPLLPRAASKPAGRSHPRAPSPPENRCAGTGGHMLACGSSVAFRAAL